MLERTISAIGLISLLCLPVRAGEAGMSQPISPKDGPIRLFDGRHLDGWYTWLSETKYEDPRKVFTVTNGLLHISGEGTGYLCTKQAYRDYHFIIEFRWGERAWANRAQAARDSGVIVHCIGPDGGFVNTFMAGIEAQMIEGGTGDFIVVPGTNVDGSPIRCSLTAETTADRDGETVWMAGGQRKTLESGRINWFGRDPDWEDKLGFQGRNDVQSPGKKWTRMDVICDKDKITILVNGVVVNKGFDARPSAGRILVQSELAEVEVRRIELWPLGKAPAFRGAAALQENDAARMAPPPVSPSGG